MPADLRISRLRFPKCRLRFAWVYCGTRRRRPAKRGKRDDGHAVTYEIAYAGEAQRGTRDTTDMRAFIDVFVAYNELVMMVVSREKGLEYLNRASQSLDISQQSRAYLEYLESAYVSRPHSTSDRANPCAACPQCSPFSSVRRTFFDTCSAPQVSVFAVSC